ncbi:hypothetical protein BC835DRAFT_1411288 [Cytidiella melzeri]|nr:hypothetical protein BC835DRAFT_1411288 [Cytidiella melzeri]
MYKVFKDISQLLSSHSISVSEFIQNALSQEALYHPFVQDILASWKVIHSSLMQHPQTCHDGSRWVERAAVETMKEEIESLVSEGAGWHFTAGHAEPFQLQELDLADMAQDINIDALTHILSQVGVGDPQVACADSGGNQAVVDVSEHVVLFYGDLETEEKIEASL